uniref:7TM GPCR serpentine receptor class x (Srx) domain-containing protein n=1 Tax=Acrobeloides nanus TaxID=290746 RepID=A0A914EDZ1_9BILA
MFTVGVIDAITLLEICFMDGYDTIIGGVFCTSPTRFYIFGVISTFGWFCGTFIGILLALDRCCEILAPNAAKYLFHGNRTWIWLGLCFLYGSYALLFQYPFVYHSRYMAVFYDPHWGDEFRVPFTNPAYYAHNLFVAAAIGSLYLIICIGWALKYKNHKTGAVSNSQRLVNIQSFMISMEILGAGLIYIYFMNFYVPDFCFLIGHVLWQMSHGDNGVVYFIINKTMRKAVIKMLKKIFCRRNGNHVSQLSKASTAMAPVGSKVTVHISSTALRY